MQDRPGLVHVKWGQEQQVNGPCWEYGKHVAVRSGSCVHGPHKWARANENHKGLTLAFEITYA